MAGLGSEQGSQLLPQHHADSSRTEHQYHWGVSSGRGDSLDCWAIQVAMQYAQCVVCGGLSTSQLTQSVHLEREGRRLINQVSMLLGENNCRGQPWNWGVSPDQQEEQRSDKD